MKTPGAERPGRKGVAGYVLLAMGGLIALLGFALPFSGGSYPPPGHPVRYNMAWEDPVGRVALAVVGAGFALSAFLLAGRPRARLRTGLTRVSLGIFLLSGIPLTLGLLTCAQDAGCFTLGALLVGIGSLVAGTGVRIVAAGTPELRKGGPT